MKARIRGIYATALTKLFLDKGWDVVQPSPKIVERLGIKPSYDPPDVTIKDDEEVRGACIVIGKCVAVNEAVKVLLSVPGTIIQRAVSKVKQVVIGRVSRMGERLVAELPGGVVGEVPQEEVIFEGAYRPFTIISTSFVKGVPVRLTTDIIVEGDYVELHAGTRKISFSRYIPPVERDRLRILASQILSEGFGVRFKSSAQYADNTQILEEVEDLKRRILEISEKAMHASSPQFLTEGRCITKIYLTRSSKRFLDSVRASIMPTVEGHHEFRTSLDNIVDLLDYVAGRCNCDFYESVRKWLLEQHVISRLFHIKLSGEQISIGPFIEQRILGNSTIVLRRRLKPGHMLDGIGKTVEEGDYALTCIELDKPYIVHSYYSSNGELKGSYVNINTEPEVGMGELRYIDLEVDVVYDGTNIKKVDEDALTKYDIEMAPDLANSINSAIDRFLVVKSVACTDQGISVQT